MKPGGWIFLSLSWAAIIWLMVWSFITVLRKKS